MIQVGGFLMVQPTSILGPEVEGGPGQFMSSSQSTVPVYLVGPHVALTGDYLVCKFVDNRWVAERSMVSHSSGVTTTVPNCICSQIPTTLSMISSDPNCNFGMFQSCSIVYGPTPSGYANLQIGVNSFLSVESFPDAVANGAEFRYLFSCYLNQFNLSRVYLESPYGSPYRDGLLYSWLISGYGNSCDPFALDYGSAYPGSDASCFVTISGG